MRAQVAARHTRWWCPPVTSVDGQCSGEAGLDLVAEAQDRGTNPTPTRAAVSHHPYRPTTVPDRRTSLGPFLLRWCLHSTPLVMLFLPVLGVWCFFVRVVQGGGGA